MEFDELTKKDFNAAPSIIVLAAQNHAMLTTIIEMLVGVIVKLDGKDEKDLWSRIHVRLAEHQKEALDLLVPIDSKRDKIDSPDTP